MLIWLRLALVLAYWVGGKGGLLAASLLFSALIFWQRRAVGVKPATDRDGLTGLLTRQHVLSELGRFLTGTVTDGRETAVLHVNIDQFSAVNSRFGLKAGDEVLKSIAARLKANVRKDDLVSRLGANDFAIVLFPLKKTDISVIMAIADRIHAALAGPFEVFGSTCKIRCCIGVCLSARAPDLSSESILQSAETALKQAQADGPGTTASFSPRMRREARDIQNLSADLDMALENREIRPFFQPQVCIKTGRVLGFEALARWVRPDGSVVLPGVFLKAIEQAGRSERLGEVMLSGALRALEEWDRTGFTISSVGVNFTASELLCPRLVEKIKWEVDRFDLAPSRINIEILENVISDHDEGRITRNIRALAAQGFGVELDDFGTGHASITNIRRFAVNRIKIDRSFVAGIDQNTEAQVIAAAIIGMARSLNIGVLAEGVETAAEQSVLTQLGCPAIQGYLVAKPMAFEDTGIWLQSYRHQLSLPPPKTRKTG